MERSSEASRAGPRGSAGARRARPSRRLRRLAVGAAAALLALAAAEVAAQVAFRERYGWWLFRSPVPIYEHDAELGWIPKVGDLTDPSWGEGAALSFDARRARRAPRAEGAPAPDVRVLCVGDSFTMGGGVGDAETWPAWIEALDPRFETVNLGVGGYGVGQAWLRYRRDGAGLGARGVVFAFVHDDVQRMKHDTFQARSPKPFVTLDDAGELVVGNVPVPTWGSAQATLADLPKRTALWIVLHRALSRSTPESRIYDVALAVFDDLGRIAAARGERLLVTYLPTLHELRAGERRSSAGVARAAAERGGFGFLDATGAFERLPRAEQAACFLPDGHYSSAGNRLVARAVLERIAGWVDAPSEE